MIVPELEVPDYGVWGKSNLVDPAEWPDSVTELGFGQHFVAFPEEKQQTRPIH